MYLNHNTAQRKGIIDPVADSQTTSSISFVARKAGGLFEAGRLSFRPPSDKRCAVVVYHRIYDDLTVLLPSFRLPGKGRQAVVGYER